MEGRMTQYWEPLKPYPYDPGIPPGIEGYQAPPLDLWAVSAGGPFFRLPHAPGDLLWVREAYRTVTDAGVLYRARMPAHFAGWRSPATMPRRFSRFTLVVDRVRIARVQEVTEADAVACGFIWSDRWEGFTPCQDGRFFGGTATASFAAFWTARHGPDAWARNEWCIVTDWNLHRCNVDMMENGR
jgi:hypothetical protein